MSIWASFRWLLLFFGLFLSQGAMSAALLDECAILLRNTSSNNAQEFPRRHWRIFSEKFEFDVVLGDGNNYFVFGPTRKTESRSSAIKNIEALQRHPIDSFRISPKGRVVSFTGESGFKIALFLRAPFNENENIDLKSFEIHGIDGLPHSLKRRMTPTAVVESELRIRVYHGAAAEEIYNLLKESGVSLEGPLGYYRGLHFFEEDQKMQAPLYLATHVETEHLLRGLRAMGLRKDHPVFRLVEN